MKHAHLAAALCFILLLGCVGTDCADVTPFPYKYNEGAWSAIGKTLVNFPIWTVEAAFVGGFVMGWAWLQGQGGGGTTR